MIVILPTLRNHHLLGGDGHHVGLRLGVPTFLVLDLLFNCVSHWQKQVKVGQKQTLQWLLPICHHAKYERSKSSHRHNYLEPENLKVGEGVLIPFAKVKVACHLPPNTTTSCMTAR